MIRSVLDNQRFDSWSEFKHTMMSIHQGVPASQWAVYNPETYRRLRMISDQYVAHRAIVQGFSSLRDIEWWLNNNPVPLLNVPMNHLDTMVRTVVKPLKMSFRDVVRDENIDTKLYLGFDFEEDIGGKGWAGDLIVESPTHARNPSQTLKQGLGSYGIYTMNIEYNPVGSKPYYTYSFVMLERDFQLKNFNEADWKYQDPSEYDDDFFDSMSEDDLERWDRDQLFDDDAQFIDMDLDDGFE